MQVTRCAGLKKEYCLYYIHDQAFRRFLGKNIIRLFSFTLHYFQFTRKMVNLMGAWFVSVEPII
jgi:hypothetical protein